MLTLLIARGSLVVALGGLLALFAAAAAGCAGGAVLEASLEGPAVQVGAESARAMIPLRFQAIASVSSPLADGGVQVVVRPEGDADDGQVRVTVYRGDQGEDAAPSNEVVPCGVDTEVSIERAALAGCSGECAEDFTVVFAAEGLESGETAELPVLIEAHLVYESAMTAPSTDTLDLALLP